jgi:hypothetical protein
MTRLLLGHRASILELDTSTWQWVGNAWTGHTSYVNANDLIKDKKRPEFDSIDADSLKLWNVSCLPPRFGTSMLTIERTKMMSLWLVVLVCHTLTGPGSGLVKLKALRQAQLEHHAYFSRGKRYSSSREKRSW